MRSIAHYGSVGLLLVLLQTGAWAGTTVFFESSQMATLVATGTTTDTISCEGYVFTYTRDKLFTGGVGLTNPVGRSVRVPWPDGVEAQYVTAGPQPTKASITIRRVDGALFDLTSFTAKLLANAGAGRAIEIIPLLNGEEPLNDPLYFDVSGNYGMSFSYDTSPNYLGSTALLTQYDAYKINLTLDYALTALTLDSAVADPNHPPTEITVTAASVLENEPVDTVVGTFSTIDPDVGDTFTYAFVGGTGSADNGYFTISGSDLLTAASFNFEIRNNYSIRVETTDQGGLSTQRVFSIQVLDADEPPPQLAAPPLIDPQGVIIQWAGQANHHYTLHVSTNLMEGFVVLASNLPAAPILNTYTDAAATVDFRCWKISTEP